MLCRTPSFLAETLHVPQKGELLVLSHTHTHTLYNYIQHVSISTGRLASQFHANRAGPQSVMVPYKVSTVFDSDHSPEEHLNM